MKTKIIKSAILSIVLISAAQAIAQQEEGQEEKASLLDGSGSGTGNGSAVGE